MNQVVLKPRRRRVYLVMLGVAVLAVGVWWYRGRGGSNALPEGLSFKGDSRTLGRTQIVQTLDTPMEKGKNVIWSASSTAAWKQLQKSVGGAVIIENAKEMSDRLNAAPDPAPDCPAGTLFANAGRVNQGIVARIQGGVRALFPEESPPSFGAVGPDDTIAYALLRAKAPFTIPYFDDPEAFEFTTSSGSTCAVRAFGIRKIDDYAYPQLRGQPKVLYVQGRFQPGEMVIDLCRDSQSVQVLVAMIAPATTLEATVAAMEKKIEESGELASAEGRLGTNDVMLIPRMAWRILHHSRELEGRRVIANGVAQPLVEVVEDIEFRLEKGGDGIALGIETACAAVSDSLPGEPALHGGGAEAWGGPTFLCGLG